MAYPDEFRAKFREYYEGTFTPDGKALLLYSGTRLKLWDVTSRT